MTRRRAFILPVALAMAALIAATVIFCAGLLRKGLAEPERAIAAAKTQALYALDIALAQLQETASADTTATAPAGVVGNIPSANWTGAWAQGNNTPVWLVSGENPSALSTGGTTVAPGLRAPSVITPTGSYAYAVEDLSQKITIKSDRLGDIPSAFGENLQRLRQQSIFVPITAGLATGELTPMSYGLLTNPAHGGWKLDLDSGSTADETTAQVARWRGTDDLIRGRPIIWAEAALLCGVYKNGAGVPQLGLAFWADAWNPYPLALPFNAKDIPDLRLRLEGPSGTVKYFSASGALVGFERLDLAAHTSDSPILTDLYGPMGPGEIRFITHYRVLPVSSADYPEAATAQIDIPAGDWSFVFETLDGQPVQKITKIPFDAISKTVSYTFIDDNNFNSNTCQWVLSFKLREPIAPMLSKVDPRGREIPFSNSYYVSDSNPAHAQSNFNSFSGGDIYRNGQAIRIFDLPDGSLVSAGSVWSMALEGAPAFGLGSAAAGSANGVLDGYFASSLPASPWAIWEPGAGTTVPNANLRLSGTPGFSELKANPAQYMLVHGAFNINTPLPQEWLAVLPTERFSFPFRTDIPAQPVAIDQAQRLAWAQAIVARLQTNGRPWRSLAELAGEDLLPSDVLCRMSALLQPRGDTFAIHIYAQAPDSVSSLRALVQRLPGSDGNARRFQILSIDWQTPPAQN